MAEFYIPCLTNSSLYQRAVGFFSSSALSSAAKGLHAFIKGGGKMQLIASPHLSRADIEEIKSGYAARAEVEERAVLRAFEEVQDDMEKGRLGLLAWLIQYNRLDMRVAVVKDLNKFGIYHEKLGIFSDGEDFVTFAGSSNESVSGLVSNFECVDVFCSWKPEDRERALEKQENFARLWDNRTNRLRVYSFPEAAKRSLLRFRQDKVPEADPAVEFEEVPVIPAGCPRVPDSIQLRQYQLDAINNWVDNKGRGTFKMATGSGKTITALATAAELYELIGLQALIVIAPYRHLVSQWAREAERFGLNPIRCFESRKDWLDLLKGQLYNLSAGKLPFVTVITTNATFAGQAFQSTLPFFPKKTLLVGDEAHNLGARHILAALPQSVGLRLALSATPERWFDDEGTDAIYNYFGPVLKPEFTLRDALERGALVPYRYYPVLVNLTDDEADQYAELSQKIGKLMNSDSADAEQARTALLNRRARLVGAAQNKLVELRRIMEGRLNTSHTLFYCGDGSVEEPASQETVRSLEAVCRILGNDLNFRVDTYTAETPLDEREELRERFVSGALQGLVAIRCLDEGVDIPLIKTAFILASSTNPRQFIQRRGRVLRPHPSKQIAEIFDFIVVPPQNGGANPEVERNLLRKELTRYVEFADLALNSGEVRGLLVELQSRYGLLSI
jgi:DNA phosphorothioation system restriction enzyme